MTDVSAAANSKITCKICGEHVHVMKVHLRDNHPEVQEAEYLERYPGAEMFSPAALARIAERAEKARFTIAAPATPALGTAAALVDMTITKRHFHEVFDLGDVAAAKSTRGAPLPVKCFEAPAELRHLVPDIDTSYVFNIELLKTALTGMDTGQPTYFWGMSGVGKTTIFEQVCARTGRPWLRIQHTQNTEEMHIVGQWVVKDGDTRYQLGPLAQAMKYGLTYCADEYDLGMPAVLMLYQAVLEGKPLIIKEADAENQVIRPHPNFVFVATGNTNGTGDETGLYQGTLVGNAANYERFSIVEEVHYPVKAVEVSIVQSKAKISASVAEKLVSIANMAREAYRAGKLGIPPSPRALVNAGRNGRLRGDWVKGLDFAYVNRLNRVDAIAVREIVQRVGLAKA